MLSCLIMPFGTFDFAVLEYLLDDCAIDFGQVEEMNNSADWYLPCSLGIEECEFGVEEAE